MSVTTVPRSSSTAAPEGRRRRWRWWLVPAFVVLVGLVAWLVWWSPVLAVRSVRVLGATTVPSDAVIAAAAVPIGTPLARVDAAAVADRVTSLPRVAGVEVRRGFPSQLVLVVTERVPVAVLPDGGGYQLVDASGVRLGRVTTKPRSLPVVNTGDDARATALAVVAGLPRDLVMRIVDVRGTTPDNLELRLGGDVVVRWGDDSRSDRKAEVLRALLMVPASVYDVSAPDLPTTRR